MQGRCSRMYVYSSFFAKTHYQLPPYAAQRRIRLRICGELLQFVNHFVDAALEQPHLRVMHKTQNNRRLLQSRVVHLDSRRKFRQIQTADVRVVTRSHDARMYQRDRRRHIFVPAVVGQARQVARCEYRVYRLDQFYESLRATSIGAPAGGRCISSRGSVSVRHVRVALYSVSLSHILVLVLLR